MANPTLTGNIKLSILALCRVLYNARVTLDRMQTVGSLDIRYLQRIRWEYGKLATSACIKEKTNM